MLFFASLRDRCHYVLNVYLFLRFVPGTNRKTILRDGNLQQTAQSIAKQS